MSLVLDAGALIAAERDDRATAAVIEAARQEHRLVLVPAGVVGPVWRGGGRQARVTRLLNARGVVVSRKPIGVWAIVCISSSVGSWLP